MAVDWPTITSLNALKLAVGDDDVSITYNPVTRSIEWSDIPMRLDPTTASRDVQLYQSPQMLLSILQPGELYQHESLDGRVEVEIRDYLLSGLQARLYDANGAQRTDRAPKLTTRITTRFRLVLDDAFAQRIRSPIHHLHFDEVIPDQARFEDIVSALRDRGFEVEKLSPASVDHASGGMRHFLLARRSEGPYLMALLLIVAGRRYQTERQNKAGGHTYKSTFDSGEMRVSVLGTLRRDSKELTKEMNALQQALRSRFDFQRARR